MKYLGATLDQSLSGANMVTSFKQKATARLKYPDKKQKFLDLPKDFGYVINDFSKRLKGKLQVTQIKS